MMRAGQYKVQDIREQYIRKLDSVVDSSNIARQMAKDLFALGLTVYLRNYSFDSILYNSFAESFLDKNISLHPEQMNALKKIELNNAVIFSAPTSAGKTFVVFEYIARFKPKNVVLIIPTLALVDEYNKKIIKKYKSLFRDYNVYLSIDEMHKYNFSEKNIFILTHDRVVEKINYSIFEEIDFLVIDEVYKLQRDEFNDRVLVLNLAYYYLSKKAKKYVLLAPFIGGVENIEKLEKKPIFFSTDYSPVVNEVKIYEIINEKERNSKVVEVISTLSSEDKMMIYFPTVTGIFSFVKSYAKIGSFYFENDLVSDFIKWIKEEIHEDWYLVKAMENGYLVHNGQLPIGIRMFQLDLYDDKESGFNKLLCTSTLLEGVNTTAKHVIISKPSRGGRAKEELNFDAFDFYNLVGRSGRLFQHFIGVAHYIKSPEDPIFDKTDAIKEIEFEVTGDSDDIDIQTDNIENNDKYKKFLEELKISHEDYKENIGARLRFETIRQMYDLYISEKNSLLEELQKMQQDNVRGRFFLVNILYKIFEGKNNKFHAGVINDLINKRRLKIKNIVNNICERFKMDNIDYVITTALRLKSSYIEHDFFIKLNMVTYFMRCQHIDDSLINIIDSKIKKNIEFLYFTGSKTKRILKDMGIYEYDVDKVAKIIGEDVADIFELKKVLEENRDSFHGLSIISKYVLRSLLD